MGALGWVRSWVAARCEGAARKVEWDAEMFRRAGRGGRVAQLVWTDSRGQTSSVVELDGQRLIEHEVRDWFALGGLEGRSLIEEEVAPGRAASG